MVAPTGILSVQYVRRTSIAVISYGIANAVVLERISYVVTNEERKLGPGGQREGQRDGGVNFIPRTHKKEVIPSHGKTQGFVDPEA